MSDIKRNYGIDIFKIVSAFMIVCLHTLTQGGIIGNINNLTVKGEMFYFFYICFYVGVNCFAVISGYLGLNANHRYSSLISLWLQVVFWSVILNIIQIIFTLIKGLTPDFWGLIKSFFPIIFQENWYFSAYFIMFFFTPLLNHLINTLSRINMKKVLLLLMIFFSLIETVSHDTVFAVNGGYTWIWLSVLYLFGAYFKKYNLFENKSGGGKKALFGFVGCMIATYISRLVIAIVTEKIFGEVKYATKFITYTSPFMILGALCLLCFFKNIHVSKRFQRSVCFVTSLTFGIYIIHTSNVIYRNVLRNAFVWIAEYNILISVIMFFACSIAVFLICALLDWLRILLFRFIKAYKFANFLGLRVEKFFEKITNKI